MIKLEMDKSTDFGNEMIRYIEKVSRDSIKDITEIVRHENTANVSGARSIYGGLVKPSKKKRGVTLIDTGKLLSSMKSKKIDSTTYEVFIAPVRSKIAGYLHYGTDRMVSRPFFGISQITLQRINEYIRKTNSKNG